MKVTVRGVLPTQKFLVNKRLGGFKIILNPCIVR